MKIKARLFIAFVYVVGLSFLTAQSSAGTYSGGAGTDGNPYKISTVADWQELMTTSADWNKAFLLTADLNLNGMDLTPVGNQTVGFSGIFDGDGYGIRNPTSVSTGPIQCVGLFGCTSNATIKNLGVINIMLSSEGQAVGGLVGRTISSTITACYVTGSVRGVDAVGGLVGHHSSGSLNACFANASVAGQSAVGGLVGENSGLIITGYATGSVGGTNPVGGLVGRNGGLVTACFAIGLVGGIVPSGGLVGDNDSGLLNACFWNMQTSGRSDGVGTGPAVGVTGKTTSEMKYIDTYLGAGWNFVSVWTIFEGKDYPHFLWEEIHFSSYSGGSGTAEDPYRIAGLDDWLELIDSPIDWDKRFVLLADIDFGGMELTPVSADTNPDNAPFDGTPFTGVFDGNNHVLRNAVIIRPSMNYLGIFGGVYSGGMIANLGVENVTIHGRDYVGGLVGWNSGTIRRSYVTGSVNGSLYVGGLAGLSQSGTIASSFAVGPVAGSEYVGGLIGGNYGQVSSSYATGSVTGQFRFVGGLAGTNDSSPIMDCFASGSVAGNSSVGGLVGGSFFGDIISSYATGSVTGTAEVGGLCGRNDYYGQISHCYATGSVTGIQKVGGLCGSNDYASITRCYAAGTVTGDSRVGGLVPEFVEGTVTSCFWDVEVSGQPTSAGGQGKTAAEMKTRSTFTGAGWDFVGESANGTADIWRLCAANIEYPRLARDFSPAGDFDCPDGTALEDLLYLSSRWLAAAPETIGSADANADGRVDMLDLTILANHWLAE